MYIIKKDTNLIKNMTIFGVTIPDVETKIDSLKKFFSKEAYNNRPITEEELFKIIKKSEKGGMIVLEKVIEEKSQSAIDSQKRRDKIKAEKEAKEKAEKEAADKLAKEKAEKEGGK